MERLQVNLRLWILTSEPSVLVAHVLVIWVDFLHRPLRGTALEGNPEATVGPEHRSVSSYWHELGMPMLHLCSTRQFQDAASQLYMTCGWVIWEAAPPSSYCFFLTMAPAFWNITAPKIRLGPVLLAFQKALKTCLSSWIWETRKLVEPVRWL